MAGRAEVMVLDAGDPVAVAAVGAIHAGDVAGLRRLLADHPGLATARLGDTTAVPTRMSRTLLHVVTDWPGHFPNGAATVAVLVAAGADVNARFTGPHTETPLHWAASSDDVEVLDALLDAGADIDAPGAVIGGGTPLADARAFGQWQAAHRLVERGARPPCSDAATLGLIDRLERVRTAPTPPGRRGQPGVLGRLPRRPAGDRRSTCWPTAPTLNWIPPWEHLTPLDAAARSGAEHLVTWLRDRGGVALRRTWRRLIPAPRPDPRAPAPRDHPGGVAARPARPSLLRCVSGCWGRSPCGPMTGRPSRCPGSRCGRCWPTCC